MMRALTVQPGVKDSMDVTDVPEPEPTEQELLVEGLAVGVCGTDRDLNGGEYGWAPPGQDRLVVGHESVGRVISAPEGSEFAEGDLVAGIVRRPDPVPCGACAHGAYDMCRNGEYTERGIKELDGYASERWVVEQNFVVRLDPTLGNLGALMEPTSVVAKAWDQIEKVGRRSWFEPKSVLVMGAGPIGLLAALFGQQKGLDVHVLDVMDEGLKPDLVRELGATYHSGDARSVLEEVDADIVIDSTGVSALLEATIDTIDPYDILCLLGLHNSQAETGVDLATLGKNIVLNNAVVVGSVNANRDHWQQAAEALSAADRDWLARLVTRTVPLSRALEALDPQRGDVKVLIDLQS